MIAMKDKFFSKKFVFSLVLCLLPILFYIPFYGQLPKQMATHFDSQGVANGYTQKEVAVFVLPLVLAAAHTLTMFITCNDPKARGNSIMYKRVLFWIIPLISIVVNLGVLMYSLGNGFNLGTVSGIVLGVIFVAIGNYLPKCQQNYTVGIKLPWTLASQENWNKTHRLAGWCFIVSGIIFIVLSLFTVDTIISIIITLCLCMAVPGIYSFLLYKRGV